MQEDEEDEEEEKEGPCANKTLPIHPGTADAAGGSVAGRCPRHLVAAAGVGLVAVSEGAGLGTEPPKPPPPSPAAVGIAQRELHTHTHREERYEVSRRMDSALIFNADCAMNVLRRVKLG